MFNPLSPLAPEPIETGIPARSKRQAMDWSLVLASQEIPTRIEQVERDKWLLLVPENDLPRALESIRLYRLENRGWAWRQRMPGAEIDIHWAVIPFGLLLIFFHLFSTDSRWSLSSSGQMDSLLVKAGEWRRLITAIFLHADIAHLAANVTFGFLTLGLAMARFGPGNALLATLFAGIFGNLCGLFFYTKPYVGLGASGMMMGSLGLIAVHSAGLWKQSRKAARYILSGVSAGFLLFVLFGLNPASDVLAHAGGFVAGVLLGLMLAWVDEKKVQGSTINIASFATFLIIVTCCWAFALQ
ncbi:MAG: rhomboid family intramembrane serine protease [Verrucomicrobiota bacterium]|nr:rhomboid family intramembrane serine protease [Verrucomicrobiota bacterium]